MFLLNVGFCSLAVVLLALVTVEAESQLARGQMLAQAEIALKQAGRHTADVRER